MSRVLDATVRGRTQAYTYDGFGNLTSITTDGTTMPIGVAEWNGLAGAGISYDAAGNLLTWRRATTDFTYDWTPTGAMKRYRSTTGVDREYAYDANGERVLMLERLRPNEPPQQATFTLRGLDQKVLREARVARGYSGALDTWMWSKDYVYGGGRLLADVAPNLGVRHMHLDHLGSVQAMTDAAKFTAGRHVYFPYGQEVPDSAGAVQFDTARMKFTGHERDTQRTLGAGWGDDLDYMHARYYNLGIGRFLSVDPTPGAPASTQSWNKFAYCLGNPVAHADPDGRNPALFALIGGAGGAIVAGIKEFKLINQGQMRSYAEINQNILAGLAGGAVAGASAGALAMLAPAAIPVWAATSGSGAIGSMLGGGLRRLTDAPSEGTTALSTSDIVSDGVAGLVLSGGALALEKGVAGALRPAVSSLQAKAIAQSYGAAADGMSITGQAQAAAGARQAIRQLNAIPPSAGAVSGEIAGAVSPVGSKVQGWFNRVFRKTEPPKRNP